jgi:hypothetical protein
LALALAVVVGSVIVWGVLDRRGRPGPPGRATVSPSVARAPVPPLASKSGPTPTSSPLVPVAAGTGGAPVQRAQTGRLRIKAPGSWVAVYVDDRKVADDAGEFEVPAGRHRLRVEDPPLHFRREEWIVVRPGSTLTREFSLDR